MIKELETTKREWSSVKEDWQEMVDVANGDKEETDDVNEDSLYDYGLSFDYVEPEDTENGYWRYQLSWGGPGTELRFFVARPDLENEQYYKAQFVYLDWNSITKIDITKDETAVTIWDFLSPSAVLPKEDA